jgi:hypothetical protein
LQRKSAPFFARTFSQIRFTPQSSLQKQGLLGYGFVLYGFLPKNIYLVVLVVAILRFCPNQQFAHFSHTNQASQTLFYKVQQKKQLTRRKEGTTKIL